MSPRNAASPTMRELARSLGVSAATVSLALRNHPRVALETRRKVQALARDRGYQLNPAVSQLLSRVRTSPRAQYQETLGWINMDQPDSFTSSGIDYQLLMWRGALERATNLGYSIDSFWCAEPGMTGKRMSAIMRARGIRGLLVPPLPRSHGHLSIKWEDFTAVAMSHTIVRPRLHRIVPDHHANMQTILRALRHRGYRRPGLLIGRGFDDRCENRFSSAFYFQQQQLPQRDRIPVRLSLPDQVDAGSLAWLRRYKPDVVITLGSYRHLRQCDVGDPEYSRRLGVVLLGYAQTDAGFCAIDENPRQIGASAVDHLAASLGRNERGLPAHPQTTLVRGSWVEGQTLPVLENPATAG